MKIAFIVNTFPKLSETFILNQITGLLNLGHDVEIFAFNNPNETKTHPDIEKYQLMKRVHYLDRPQNKVNCILKAIFLITTNIHKSPVKILKSLNIFKYGTDALSLKLFYTLIPFLGKKLDITHCHFGPNGISALNLKEIGVVGKIITTFHGYDLSMVISSNGYNVYNDLFHKGDIFLPISNYWGEKLIKLNCDKNKITVHHMGISLDKFKYSERKIHSDEAVKILTIGRLTEKKGHAYVIKALAKVVHKHKHKKIIYHIAGDGPLKCELKSLVTKLGINNYVKFWGNVEDGMLLRLYQESHIFVLASITAPSGDKEGIPVVLMEAEATGLPVISTFHSGIPEIVIDGKSGFLVPERDVDALAKKIECLIENPKLWSKMGKYGRKFVEENYNIKKLNHQLVKIYQTILSNH